MSVAVFSLALLSLAILVLFGFFTISLVWPSTLSRGLIWAFAPAVGAGICSFIFVLFRRPMFTIELTLLLASAAAYFFIRRPVFKAGSFTVPPLPVSAIFLVMALGIAISQCMVVIERAPHGDWDATAIWNSHSRYLYRDGPGWQTHIQNTLHPDYPLLVPSLVARLWRYIGTDIPDAASVPGALFVFAGIAILVAVLTELRGVRVAVIIALVLTATPFYIHYGVAQSADVPLSLYILSTVALICLHRAKAPDRLGLMLLAGFTAGCAAWVKNEGLLFVLAASLAVLLPVVKEPSATLRRFFAFAAGAVLPLLVVLWFKITIAPANDIVGHRHYAEMMEKMANPDRHRMILQSFSHTFWSFGDWLVNPLILLLVYLAVYGIDRKMIRNAGWLQGLVMCFVVISGYYLIYLVTPMDLQWHLGSSLPRLYLHLWPTGLLLAGLAVASGDTELISRNER